jgi:hypothetical protein
MRLNTSVAKLSDSYQVKTVTSCRDRSLLLSCGRQRFSRITRLDLYPQDRLFENSVQVS